MPIDQPVSNDHYDKNYFDWQKTVGEFGGRANQVKFEKYIKPTDKVVDFGAGGGFLLAHMRCAAKTGVEVNPVGRDNGALLGVQMVESFDALPDDYADVVVSNNALEHTDYPLCHLQQAYAKLKPGGLLVFVVPCEQIGYAWEANDINFHIYSWSPMAIGNLATRAGFQVIESRPFFHKWPPRYYVQIQKLLGWKIFHLLSRINGRIMTNWVQVRCVARKPA